MFRRLHKAFCARLPRLALASIFITALVAGQMLSDDPSESSADSHLLLYLSMDGETNGAGSGGFSATMANFPEAPFVPGVWSNALQFSSNSYLAVQGVENLLPTNGFTLSMLFSGDGGGEETTLAQATDALGRGWTLGLSTDGVARLRLTDPSGGAQVVMGGEEIALSLRDGRWHHLVTSYQPAAGEARVTVDGVTEASTSVDLWQPAETSSLTLGSVDEERPNPQFTFTDSQRITLAKVEDVIVHSSDPETFKTPSVLAESAKPLLHFVTARQQGNVVLQAIMVPDTAQVRDAITWTSSDVALTSPAIGSDKRTVKFSSNVATGKKITIDININGPTCRSILAWVVSAHITTAQVDPPQFEVEESTSTSLVNANFKYTIKPLQIITDTDIPDLRGDKKTNPPSVPFGFTTVFNADVPLGGGANARWDVSRQIRQAVDDPKNALPSHIGPFGTYKDYPSVLPTLPEHDVIGNRRIP